MVNQTTQPMPMNVVGGNLDDFPVMSKDIEHYKNSLHSISLEMEKLTTLVEYLESEPSPEMLSYALEKFELKEIISVEDINKSALLAWDRMKLNLKRYQSDLFSYAKVIQSGAERTVEHLKMLDDMCDHLNSVPNRNVVELKNNRRFGIDGKLETRDMRPMMEQLQNVFDFYDKVLIDYMKDIDKVLLKMQIDHEWTDDTLMRFEKYEAKRWMSNSTPMEEEDKRFRVSSNLTRSVIAQGDKAIYFAGPTATKTEKIKDWDFMLNTVRNFRLKYYPVTGAKELPPDDNKIEVDKVAGLRQRIRFILGAANRIVARDGYDKKISIELRKLENSCDKLRNKTRSMRTQVKKNVGEEEKDPGRPVVSNIVKDLVMIMTSMTRLVTDFNNCLAAQLRLIGALGYIVDQEVKAYEIPIKQPTQEVKEKLDK